MQKSNHKISLHFLHTVPKRSSSSASPLFESINETTIEAASKQISHDLANKGFQFEGGILDPMIEGALMLVPEKYQTLTASVSNVVICLANTYILESLSVVLGVAINPISGINTTALALASIKKNIKELQKEVDKLMHADYKTAFKKYDNALSFMTNPETHRYAFREFEKVKDLAERAYSQVNEFDKKILCKKLALFGHLMMLMYQKGSVALF